MELCRSRKLYGAGFQALNAMCRLAGGVKDNPAGARLPEADRRVVGSVGLADAAELRPRQARDRKRMKNDYVQGS